AGAVVALVEVDLGARPTWAVVTHRPEVVLLSQPQYAVVCEAGHLLPESERVVVVGEDRGREAPRVEPEVARQELPGEGDRLRLEVVAEGEVPEHLEEGVVARGPADVLEIVVLAARADALLAGGRAHVVAPFLTEEHGLELHHARVREEEGRVGSGDERRRPHARVTVLLEIGHELLADRAAGHRKAHCTPVNPRPRARWTRAGPEPRPTRGIRGAGGSRAGVRPRGRDRAGAAPAGAGAPPLAPARAAPPG